MLLSPFLQSPKPSASHPSQSRSGRAGPRPTQHGTEPRCAKVGASSGALSWSSPLSHRQGDCPAHCGSCCSSSPMSTSPPGASRRAHTLFSLALGFLGHMPRAFVSSNRTPPAGAVLDTDSQAGGIRSTVPLAQGKGEHKPPGHRALSHALPQPSQGHPHFREEKTEAKREQADWRQNQDRKLRLPFPPSFLHSAAP